MGTFLRPFLPLLAVASLATLPLGGPAPRPSATGGAQTLVAPSATAGPRYVSYGSYSWPVRGPVIRPFDPPASAYGPGHRGIDIAAPVGTAVRAAADGVVAFAGAVAGGLFVSVDHPDGVRTTYSWLSHIAVDRGQHVLRGAVLGASGRGHQGIEPAHLHFGARVGTTYIDPMLLLERGSLVGLVHLAPLDRPS
ncbi:MAG: murein hydrolase activator EnvC family protein [Actinomycetota bacterium]